MMYVLVGNLLCSESHCGLKLALLLQFHDSFELSRNKTAEMRTHSEIFDREELGAAKATELETRQPSVKTASSFIIKVQTVSNNLWYLRLSRW